jgi:hypothetical protein
VVRYNAEGLDGLTDRPKPGRPQRLTEGEEAGHASSPERASDPRHKNCRLLSFFLTSSAIMNIHMRVGTPIMSPAQKGPQKMPSLPTVQPEASLAQRLRAFVWRVVGAMTPRTRRAPAVSVAPKVVPVETKRWIAGWVRKRCAALSALAARVESGRQGTFSRSARRTDSQGTAPASRRSEPGQAGIARQFGWMCHWAPETEWAGIPVRELLDGARMRALVLAAPEPMTRAWSPLLNALGQETPEWFPVMPKRAQRKRSPAHAKADAAASGEVADPAPDVCEAAPSSSASRPECGAGSTRHSPWSSAGFLQNAPGRRSDKRSFRNLGRYRHRETCDYFVALPERNSVFNCWQNASVDWARTRNRQVRCGFRQRRGSPAFAGDDGRGRG